MTKPFYKQNWFVVFIIGLVFMPVGFILSAESIFANASAGSSVNAGTFFGMGIAFFISSGGIRQLEKKLAANNIE